MKIVRNYFILMLLIASVSVHAVSDADDLGGVWSPAAKSHYMKQMGYGAGLGAFLGLGASVLSRGEAMPSENAQSLKALAVLTSTFFASRYIKKNAETNRAGAGQASPIIAWGANAAGCVFLGGVVVTFLTK